MKAKTKIGQKTKKNHNKYSLNLAVPQKKKKKKKKGHKSLTSGSLPAKYLM